MSSSSSEEHNYYSGDEVDFGDEPALPDTSKFSYISEEEMQMYISAMVLPSGEITTTEGISSFILNYFPIELDKCFIVSSECVTPRFHEYGDVTATYIRKLSLIHI